MSDYIYIEQDNYPYNRIYWLFYVSGEFDEEPCVYHYELNQEYNNFFATHMDVNGRFHYHPTYEIPYFDCVIHDEHLYNPAKRSDRIHTAWVLYAYTVDVAQ